MHDPSLAPEGTHVVTIGVRSQPYTLRDAAWDDIKEDVADRVVAHLGTFVPNLPGSILHREVLTPLDLERRLSLTGGHHLHGDMSPDQLLFLRPVRGYADYRTPVDRLYLVRCGHASRRRRHRRERTELRTRSAPRREREGLMLDRFDELADGLNHPEGVAWNPFDGLIYAGGEGGELYAVTLDGEVELRGTTGGSMLGIAVDGAGRVYACDAGRGEIARMDPMTGVRSVYARGVDDDDLDTPNVAAFGPDGALYVTCSGEDDRPEIVRIAPGGRTERWTTAVPKLSERLPGDAGRVGARRRGG